MGLDDDDDTLRLLTGTTKLNYEDYLELPEDGKRYQILDGELDVTPSPVPYHQIVSKELGHVLYEQLERKGAGILFYAPIDVVLAEHDIVVPDIVFVREARRSIIGETHIAGAPDLIIEVLSKRTRMTDIKLKRDRYARAGVESYWIADPKRKTLTILRLEREKAAYVVEATIERPGTARPAAFPGLEVPLARVFP